MNFRSRRRIFFLPSRRSTLGAWANFMTGQYVYTLPEIWALIWSEYELSLLVTGLYILSLWCNLGLDTISGKGSETPVTESLRRVPHPTTPTPHPVNWHEKKPFFTQKNAAFNEIFLKLMDSLTRVLDHFPKMMILIMIMIIIVIPTHPLLTVVSKADLGLI